MHGGGHIREGRVVEVDYGFSEDFGFSLGWVVPPFAAEDLPLEERGSGATFSKEEG